MILRMSQTILIVNDINFGLYYLLHIYYSIIDCSTIHVSITIRGYTIPNCQYIINHIYSRKLRYKLLSNLRMRLCCRVCDRVLIFNS